MQSTVIIGATFFVYLAGMLTIGIYAYSRTGNLYEGFVDVDVTPSIDYIELLLLAKFTFGARYQRGFTNLVESGTLDILGSEQTFSVGEFKNYGFTFMAGFRS